MRTFLYLGLTLIVALANGFVSVRYTLEDGRKVSAQEYGVWYGWPNSGVADIDPYRKARLARTGHLPLGRAEGISLFAEQDENSDQLSGNCTYNLAGSLPKSSAWSLRGINASGETTEPQSTVHFLRNSEISYSADENFSITLSALAQPGNWLKTPASDYVLILTLYDTSAFAGVGNEQITLPQINKGACL